MPPPAVAPGFSDCPPPPHHSIRRNWCLHFRISGLRSSDLESVSCQASTQSNRPPRMAAASRFRRQAPWPLRLDAAAAGDGRDPVRALPRALGYGSLPSLDPIQPAALNGRRIVLSGTSTMAATFGRCGGRGRPRSANRPPCVCPRENFVSHAFSVYRHSPTLLSV